MTDDLKQPEKLEHIQRLDVVDHKLLKGFSCVLR